MRTMLLLFKNFYVAERGSAQFGQTNALPLLLASLLGIACLTFIVAWLYEFLSFVGVGIPDLVGRSETTLGEVASGGRS
jgi:hypothetical protein